MAMLATLKSSLIGCGLVRARQTHCRSVPVQAMISVSGRLRAVTQIRLKQKLTDIVPVIPGRWSLNPEARLAIRK